MELNYKRALLVVDKNEAEEFFKIDRRLKWRWSMKYTKGNLCCNKMKNRDLKVVQYYSEI